VETPVAKLVAKREVLTSRVAIEVAAGVVVENKLSGTWSKSAERQRSGRVGDRLPANHQVKNLFNQEVDANREARRGVLKVSTQYRSRLSGNVCRT